MVTIFEVCYILCTAAFLFLIYRIDSKVLNTFDDLCLIGGEIINRLDRISGVLSDVAHSFHNDYDFLSNKLFKDTVESSTREITKEILKELTTKNGKLKKSIVKELVAMAKDKEE